MKEEKQLPSTAMSESSMSTLILKGDISKLSDEQKVEYYHAICNRLGVDPMTKPFDYLVLQGKQTLYLNKGGAEQLNKVHKVSMSITNAVKFDDIYVVTSRASVGDRHTDSTGAVNIKGLYGDALCNAMMKAETKAKRRATISLLGLAMLDETEVETIPNARTHEAVVEVSVVEVSDVEPDPTVDDWNRLKAIGKENRWPENYMRTWLDNAKKYGKSHAEIYQDALERFGKVNGEEEKEEATV